jgi:hypothetical protein
MEVAEDDIFVCIEYLKNRVIYIVMVLKSQLKVNKKI